MIARLTGDHQGLVRERLLVVALVPRQVVLLVLPQVVLLVLEQPQKVLGHHHLVPVTRV